MSPPDGTTGALRNDSSAPRNEMTAVFLIDQPDRELHLSPVSHQRVDLPRVGQPDALVVEDRRAVGIVERDVEVCSIEQIESLESQLHLHAGGERRGLHQPKINRGERGPFQTVSPRIAARPRRGESETLRIEPEVRSAAARHVLWIASWHQVRPAGILGAAVAIGIARNDWTEWSAAGVRPDHVDLPSAVGSPFSERQLVRRVHRQVVPHVEVRAAPVQIVVVWIESARLPVAELEAAAGAGAVIHRLPIGVRKLRLKSIRSSFFQADTQAVVLRSETLQNGSDRSEVRIASLRAGWPEWLAVPNLWNGQIDVALTEEIVTSGAHVADRSDRAEEGELALNVEV